MSHQRISLLKLWRYGWFNLLVVFLSRWKGGLLLVKLIYKAGHFESYKRLVSDEHDLGHNGISVKRKQLYRPAKCVPFGYI